MIEPGQTNSSGDNRANSNSIANSTSNVSSESSVLIPEGRLRASLEALLFASGDGLSLEDLMFYLETDEGSVRRALADLVERYAKEPLSGLKLTRVRERYSLTTKESTLPVLERFFQETPQVTLSRAAYETLAVVAYNQPCTRAEIEAVRGVNSDSSLSRLLDYDLVEVTERLEAPGRPALYACTTTFYRLFGLKDSSDLPARGYLIYDSLEDLQNQQQALLCEGESQDV